jgi:WhiB family redox-sensing transcriptional regulator
VADRSVCGRSAGGTELWAGFREGRELPTEGGLAIVEWWELAACAAGDGERFFPEGQSLARQIAEAKAVCHECPVRSRCLSWALTMDVSGVWGGHSQRERRSMRRRRKRAVAV